MSKTKIQATYIGFIAIVLWGFLAFLTQLTDSRVPPFQMVAFTFSIGASLIAIRWIIRKENGFRHSKQPKLAWIIGVSGLFGYHFFYFVAMRLAPAVEVSLIAYLWPLLIVVFSSFLPAETLKTKQIIGTIIAFIGCFILVGKTPTGFNTTYLPGYLIALLCSLVWASYSVLNRLVKEVPTDAVAWFMIVAAILSLCCHLLFEDTTWPENTRQWIGLMGLGLGPLGLAFFAWDYGTKHGNIQLLGTLAYLAPLLSVLVLILAGMGESTIAVWLACFAIIGGSLIAASALENN